MDIKIVTIGSKEVGKTCLLKSYHDNNYVYDYIPTIMEINDHSVDYHNCLFNLSLYDINGEEEYKRIRSLAYPKTDIFLICYSVVHPLSYENIKNNLIPEIKHQCPNIPFIIIGTKIDLREDKQIIDKLKKDNKEILTFNDGITLANDVNAIGYLESSALTKNGINNIFNEIYNYIIEREQYKYDKDYNIKDYFINSNYNNIKQAKSAYK